VDAYGVLGSGAMADPCWLACALGVMGGGGCAGGGLQGYVSGCGLSRETATRESVSLCHCLSLSLSLCLRVCVFGSAWMCTVCLAVERWLTLAGLLARLV
jgi:hypothetical protein